MALRVLIAIVAALVVLVHINLTAQRSLTLVEIRATTDEDLRTWDAFTTSESRSGGLRLRSIDRDPVMRNRTIERFDQFHNGIRVWGADLVRDSEFGVAKSILGTVVGAVSVDLNPSLSAEHAEIALVERTGGEDPDRIGDVEMVILPLHGSHRLSYTAVVSNRGGVWRLFVDAGTGAELLRINEIQMQSAVGTGRGVLGDQKKLSVLRQGGRFVTDDQHRPPVLTTFDMRGNLSRAINVVERRGALFASDVASDADNEWTDVAAVDAHGHIGWTYDYFFKRFERHGLDDRDRPVVTLINGVTQQGSLNVPPFVLSNWVLNAFWCGSCGPGGVGVMYFGNGIPSGFFFVATGQNYGYLAGSLDIAAHELAHGVTDSSSRLIYQNESGALNEAFSDMMGTSVEFFYQPVGNGQGQADYLIGEDTIRAVRPGSLNGIRSLGNPGLYGDPDHYSRRYTGSDDDGGVHTNSGIPNHAFYLAIEGGTNRTSGLSVQGVSANNREQIERVFYRAFVFLLPSSANFSLARVATIQAARDLYGIGSAPERAISQAWTAVGVN